MPAISKRSTTAIRWYLGFLSGYWLFDIHNPSAPFEWTLGPLPCPQNSMLQPDKVRRNMILSGSQLLVHFTAVEARFLRASFSAFMDILVLATKTIEQFGAN
eukprot:Gb_05075 [translate_table: standard]